MEKPEEYHPKDRIPKDKKEADKVPAPKQEGYTPPIKPNGILPSEWEGLMGMFGEKE